MKKKHKQVILATATMPLMVSGLVLPMGNESVVQKAKAEGVTENQKEQFVDGESFWQDKYNPWNMYFLTKKDDGKFYDVFYDGQKMVTKPARSVYSGASRILTTTSGRIFNFANSTIDNLDGFYDPETGVFQKLSDAGMHPFPKASTGRYPSIFNIAESNGTLVANGGFSANWKEHLYYSYSKDDGETWTNISTEMKDYGFFRNITQKDGKFYAQREHGGNSYVSSSEDGINWTDEYSFPHSFVFLFEHGDNITAITGYNDNIIYKSSDGGKTFTQHAKTQPKMLSVTHKDGKFIGYIGDKLYHSEDAINWELTKTSVNGIKQIYVDEENDRFVILANSYVAISKDGENWTKLDLNIPDNPLHLKFAASYDPLPIQEKKTAMKTVNDSLPLGDKFWDADTSHIFMSYINTPLQLPEGMKTNHARLLNPRDIHIKKDGKMIHGHRNSGGLTTYNIQENKYNPSLMTYTQAGQYTTGLRTTDAIVLKDGRIASSFMTSYKGTPKGIAFFNADDFTGEKRGEVLPTDVVPISYKNYTPVKVVEGDGYIGVLSNMLENNKYTSVFHISRDGGETWTMSNEVSGRMNDVEMTEEGKIVLFGDAHLATGYPAIATSEDGGTHFENIQNIKGLTESYSHIHRSSLHNVAYRDGVYVWSFGRPYVSTDLINWTPVRPTGERNSLYDIKASTVEYDPLNDAFILSFENYLGISRDGVNWRELHVHGKDKSQTDYKFYFESLTITSDELTDNGVPINKWQTETAKDETAPTASVGLETEDWTSQHATINVSDVQDEGQGFDYMVLPDGTISSESSINFVATENGTYTIKLYDKVGNVKEYVVDVSNIDKTPATIEVEQSTAEWTNEKVELSVNATDTESGISHIELPNGDKVESHEATYEAVENGEYLFKVVDKAGNVKEHLVKVENIDSEAPEVMATASTEQWTKGNVVLSVSASDALSGVVHIELPNGEKVSADKADYSVSQNGEYVFQAVDNVGNKTEYRYVVNNIDTSPASATIEADTTSPTKEDIVLTIQARDGESGVKMITLPTGKVVEADSAEMKVSENGIYTFEVEDKAGNVSEFIYEVKNIDRSAGDTVLKAGTEGWTNEKISVNVNASDEGAGVDYVLTPDGEKVYSESFDYDVTENGKYSFVTVDKAGNEWEETIEVNNLDRKPGTGTITPSTTKSTNAMFGVVLTATATDAESGVEFIVLPDGTIVEAEKATFRAHENGKYTFGFIDRAGNAWESSYEVTNLKGKAYWVHQHIVSDWYDHFKKKVNFIKGFLRWLF